MLLRGTPAPLLSLRNFEVTHHMYRFWSHVMLQWEVVVTHLAKEAMLSALS